MTDTPAVSDPVEITHYIWAMFLPTVKLSLPHTSRCWKPWEADRLAQQDLVDCSTTGG